MAWGWGRSYCWRLWYRPVPGLRKSGIPAADTESMDVLLLRLSCTCSSDASHREQTQRWEIVMNRTAPVMSWIWCFASLCTYWLFWIYHVCIQLFYAAGHKWMYWLSNWAKVYKSNPFRACCCIVIVYCVWDNFLIPHNIGHLAPPPLPPHPHPTWRKTSQCCVCFSIKLCP